MAKTRKKRGKKQSYSIKTIGASYRANLEGLKTFVSTFAPVVVKHDRAVTDRMSKNLDKVLRIVGISSHQMKTAKKTPKRKITKKQLTEILKILKDTPRSRLRLNTDILYKSSFVMLVSYFDFLVSDLIHHFYQNYPESLQGKELSITLNELRACNDIEEALDHIVSQEVDRTLQGSLGKQMTYFEKFLKIDSQKTIINWDKITEAMERRHIIVHNDSTINKRYLNNVPADAFPGSRGRLKEGQQVAIAPDYFMDTFKELLVAGIILIQSCWRKWRRNQTDKADEVLNANVYSALEDSWWTVAEALGLFSKQCDIYDSEHRLYLNVNYWQSLKWQGKKRELQKELKEFDVSGLSPQFHLALAALKSDKDSFYKNVKRAITADGLTIDAFMQWPLFREFREDPDYEKRVKRVFRSIAKARRK